MFFIKELKNRIIKLLGGYTEREYRELEDKYKESLYKDINSKSIEMINESQFELLSDLDDYAQKSLYGLELNDWVDYMFNVIHNNKLRLLVNYLQSGNHTKFVLNLGLNRKNLIIQGKEKEGTI